LADEAVFEVDTVLTSAPSVPRWSFLLLSHVVPGVSARAFLRAEQDAGGALASTSQPNDGAPFRVLRVEVLHSTPSSYYPVPALRDRGREASAQYVVEYIAVHATPAALNEYRETMRRTIGPAVGQLVRDGKQFSFVALETVGVEASRAGMPSWNQIHLNGWLPDVNDNSDNAFDAALLRIDPASRGSAAIFERLGAIRTRARVDVVHQVSDLSVR